MPSIDERIVQMQFDNKDFEKNVQVSIKSLEDLKKSLELDKAAKSLESIENAVKGVDLSSLSKAVDTIAGRFTNLGIVGTDVLRKLTGEAFDIGKKFVKSLTTDQINAGFNKYAEKTKSVQTIINATGLAIDDVDEQLSKLAWYTDETSYSFTDMVSNIGKFTSMNIPLDTSVKSMMGIANWAAASGQGISEASRAMYNLSQAIGAGAVKKIDWMSIQNANMATAEFKQNVIETAKALGVLSQESKTAKGVVVTTENFAETLQYGWFNKDVLVNVLEQYGEFSDAVYDLYKDGDMTSEAIAKASGTTSEFAEKAFKAAQEARTFKDAIDAVAEASASQWMQTFEMIFGNYEEAKVLWTDLANDLYDIFVTSSEERNKMLKEWKSIGGRDSFLEGLYNSMAALKGVIAAVKQAISEIIPPIAAENLKDISDKFRDWTEQLKETYGLVEKWAGKKTIITEWRSEGFEKWEQDLQKGSKNDAVTKLQERLINAGYNLDKYGADGIYGPETEAAVKKLQEDLGLAVTGVYDEVTHEAFGKSLGLIGKRYEKIDQYVEDINPKLKSLMNVVKGLASVIKTVFNFVIFGVKVVGKLLCLLSPVGDLLLDIFGFIGEIFTGINEGMEGADVFGKWLQSIDVFLGPARDAMQGFTDSIRAFIFGTEDAPNLLGQLRNGSISLGDAWAKVKASFMNSDFGKAISALILKIGPNFEKLREKLKSFYGDVKENLGLKLPVIWESVSSGLAKIGTGLVNFATKAYDAIKGSESLRKAWNKLKGFVKGFGKSLGKFGQGVWDAIVGIFEGKNITDVWNKLKEDLGSVGEFFKNTWESIKGYFKGIIGESSLLSGVFDKIGIVVKPVKNVVTGFIETLVNAISTFLGTDTSNIEGFWEKVKEKLKGFESFSDWFKGIKDGIKQSFDNIIALFKGEDVEGGLFGTISDTIHEFSENFSKLDIKKVLKDAAIGIGVALLIHTTRNIGNLISTFKLFAKAYLYKNGGGLGGIVREIGKALLSVGGSALMMGAGVGLLVLSIDHLISIVAESDPKDLDKALEIIQKFAEMFAVVEGIKGVAAGFSHGTFNFSIDGAISVALGLLVFTWALGNLVNMYKAEGIDSEYISKAIENLALILGEFAVFNTISSFGTGGIRLSGALSTALGLLIIVRALKNLVKLYKDSNENGEVTRALWGIEGLLILLAGFSTAGSFSSNAWGGFASGSGVFAMALGLKLLVDSLASLMPALEKVDTEKLKTFLHGLEAIIAIMGGSTFLNTAFSNNNGWSALDSVGEGSGIFAALFGLKLFAEALGNVIPSLKDVDTEKMKEFLYGMETLIGELAGSQALNSAFTKSKKGWSSLDSVGEGSGIFAALYGLKLFAEALGNVIPSLKDVDTEKMKEFLYGMETLIGELAGSQVLNAAFTKSKKGWSSLDSVGEGSGIFAALYGLKLFAEALGNVIPSLKDVDTEKMKEFLYGMETLIGELAGSQVLNSAFTKPKKGWSALDSVGEGSGIFAALYGLKLFAETLGDVLPSLKDVDTEKMKEFFYGMESVIGIVAGAQTLTSGLTSVFGSKGWGALGQIAQGGGVALALYSLQEVVKVFGDVMPKLKDVDAEAIAAFMSNLNTALVSIETFTGIASNISAVGSSNMFLAGLALSGVIGILGKIGADVTDRFSSVLSLVGGRLNEFSSQMNGVDVGNFEKLANIATILSGSVGSIVDFNKLEDEMDNFTSMLTSMAGSIWLFTLGTAGVNEIRNNALTSFGQGVKQTVDVIAGITNYQSAVDVLSAVGGALGVYFGNIKDITYDESNNPPAEAIKSAFTGLAQAIPDNSTLTTIAGFGEGEYGGVSQLAIGLQNLSTAMGDYGTQINNINPTQVEAANAVLDKIVSVKDKVSNIDSIEGFFNHISGKSSSFTGFITDISSLGLALGTYGRKIGNLKPEQVKTANSILENVSSIKLDKTGGFWQLIVGEENLGQFATNVGDIGRGLASFGESIKDVTFDETKIRTVSSLLRAIAYAASIIPETGGMLSWLTGDENIGKLGTELGEFSQGLTSSLDEVKAAPSITEFDNVFQILDKLSLFQERIKLIDYAGDTRQSDVTFSSLSEALIRFLNEVSNVSGDTGLIEAATNVGKSINWAIGDGIIDAGEGGGIEANLGTVLGGLSSVNQQYASTYRAIGIYIDSGIAKGIKTNERVVKNALKTVIDQMVQEALSELEINSPSHVFERMGKGIDEGLVLGISEKSKSVFAASRDIAETGSEGFKSGLQLFAEALNLPEEESPVIRPVLDLTNITEGMGGIGSLFGDQTMAVRSASIASTIGQQRGTVGGESLSSGDQASISASISKLNDRLSSLETSIRNMKVVTETGALIGQIASGIDDKLGEFAYLSERGL